MRSDVSTGDAVQELINEHQTIKGLLERLESSTGTEATSILEQLKGILTVHNAVEENLVYPALRVVANKKSESLKLYGETAEADTLIFEIDTMLKEGATAEFSKRVKKLHAAVLEHIDDEESKAFKHLQDNAEPAQTQQLNESVREFRSKLHFEGSPSGRATTGEI
ncbi:MAG TPA: hemerythrin domain-containing protein [Candidatus Baltobacteraceae bacterium]|nr:hemerythrin domain-containing protein [Candidatus Baltobacteraceae bacterium]